MKLRDLRISRDRRDIVFTDISEGSEPEMRFYIMVAVSTMIASFGLITNSTAVIIGAMLVAPLMTPIFGIGLALIRSDGVLFGKALKAEIAGVVAAITMGIVLGVLYPALEPTPEMLSRTEPQLFDLLVAVFSGFAGAYALMDEKISPALPGVAIATAIVPPLANTGLCFSVGQYVAGIGSFLLFFANFLSILLVASATFWVFGMIDDYTDMDKKVLVRRFGLPVLCFILVAAFLTRTLFQISQHHYISKDIEYTLQQELAAYQGAVLDRVKYHREDAIVYILAEIHSSSTFSPTQVDRIEKKLQERLGRDAKLIVRSMVVHEISALGSPVQLAEQKLDGSFIRESLSPHVLLAKRADTIIRNELAQLVGFHLDNAKVFMVDETPTILAAINGVSTPHPDSISEMESILRRELQLPDLRLVISFVEANYYDNSGPVRLEFAGLVPNYSDETRQVLEKGISVIENALVTAFPDLTVSGVNFNTIDGSLFVLFDTVGPERPTVGEIQAIEQEVSEVIAMPVRLYIYAHPETVVSASGYEPYWSVTREGFKRLLPSMKEVSTKILEASNM